ncbi:MAG: hypothetical protein KatS3mg089_0818 [Patescibacteria group bacterium]|nr:MAG: hypothetical protein KatS3mg089_0818 [Patescibacteria group bacterium]
MWQKIFSDKRSQFFSLIILILIGTAIPLTILLSQQEQDIRQQAAETSQVCSTDQATDTMLIIDRSGSMGRATSTTDPTPRIDSAKTAANAFLDILAQRTAEPKHAVSLTTISSESMVKLDPSLTQDLQRVKAVINSLTPGGGTCIECAIKTAADDFANKERSGIKNIAVMLTDGGATQYIGGPADTSPTNRAEAEKRAFERAMQVHKQYNVTFYTIGFGDVVKDELLLKIATSSGGEYVFAPSKEKLKQIYENLAKIIGKGSVTGNVFNDLNGNGIKETNEPFLPGWKVDLLAGNTVVGNSTTSDEGYFSITGICDGTYQLKLNLQPGWRQTTPINNGVHPITISKGSTITDKLFGVQLMPKATTLACLPSDLTLSETPGTITATLRDSDGNPIPGQTLTWSSPNPSLIISPTSQTTGANGTITAQVSVGNPEDKSEEFTSQLTVTSAGSSQYNQASCIVNVSFKPNVTTLSFNIFLHGIGKSGDNANPNRFDLSNANPLNPERPFLIEVYSIEGENPLIARVQGTLVYDSKDGIFRGTIQLPNTVQSGKYNIFVKSPQYIFRRVPQTLTIVKGQQYIVPTITLVSGDVDDNDELDILDYNILAGCYSDFAPAPSCTEELKQKADLRDDGQVNQEDVNLFLRELSVQRGDQRPNQQYR